MIHVVITILLESIISSLSKFCFFFVIWWSFNNSSFHLLDAFSLLIWSFCLSNRIHSQYTVSILLVGTLFLTIKHFGDPIECLSSNNNDISAKLLQHWCWLEGSFSVVDSTGKAAIDNVAYPGVKTLNEENGEKRRLHKYYQWVYFVLIIQVSCLVNHLKLFILIFWNNLILFRTLGHPILRS